MRVLVTGAGGQLAVDLIGTAPPSVELVALDHGVLDITDDASVHQAVTEYGPEVIINTASYTAVDRAEEEQKAARLVNGDAVGRLARRADLADARLIHLSTDFVFDGTATEPYRPEAATNPLSVYGASKLEGELRALESPSSTVVRTSRLFSGHGDNFVETMLRLMLERDELTVVDDQTGSPTWSQGLAGVLWRFAARPDLTGIWHWSDGGSCTWYQWAVALQQQALARGLLERTIPITPVPTSDYPTPATRPSYSVLDVSATCAALEVQQVPWENTLGSMLDEMATPTAS